MPGKQFYSGEWLNDKPHGRGFEIFKMRDGKGYRIFDGQFENGMRNGFGKLSEDTQIVLSKKYMQKLGLSLEISNHFDDDSITNWYSFEGTWKNGGR